MCVSHLDTPTVLRQGWKLDPDIAIFSTLYDVSTFSADEIIVHHIATTQWESGLSALYFSPPI